MTTQNSLARQPQRLHRKAVGRSLVLAAIGFVLLYLATDFVVSSLASSALPLPDAPVSEARSWFADNQPAAVMLGLCQLLSVGCLAVYVARFRHVAAPERAAAIRVARTWGFVAVAAMALSSAAAWLLAGIAPSASLDTVSAVRTTNFVAGGTAHVLALGLFVVLAARMPGFGRAVRVLGYVAAGVSVLSLISLVWFEGAAFILLGRLLCMVWTISAAVSVARRGAEPQ